MDYYRSNIEAELEKDEPNQKKMAFWLAQLGKLEANQTLQALPGNLHNSSYFHSGNAGKQNLFNLLIPVV